MTSITDCLFIPHGQKRIRAYIVAALLRDNPTDSRPSDHQRGVMTFEHQ